MRTTTSNFRRQRPGRPSYRGAARARFGSLVVMIAVTFCLAGSGCSRTSNSGSGAPVDTGGTADPGGATPTPPPMMGGAGDPAMAPAGHDAEGAADPMMAGMAGTPEPMGMPDDGYADYAAQQAASAGGPARSAAPKRPTDVADWTPADFASAVAEKDAQLVKAVEHLGESSKGDPQAAELLGQILEAVGQEPAPASRDRSRSTPMPGIDPAGTTPFPGATPEDLVPAGEPQGATGAPSGAGTAHAAHVPPSRAAAVLLSALIGFQEPGELADPAAVPGFDTSAYPGAMEGGYGSPASGRLNKDAVVRAIVTALVQNDTPAAWQTLQRLAAGEIKTGVPDAKVVEWVVAAAIDNYGGANHPSHRLLQQVLSDSRPLEQAEGASTDVQKLAMELHLHYAASVMDALLDVPDEATARQGRSGPNRGFEAGFDGAADPAEYAAGADGTSGQQRPKAAAITIQKRPLTADQLRQAFGYMTQPDLLSAVESRTREMPRIGTDLEPLALAAMLPSGRVRAAIHQHFEQNWQDGADVLRSSGFFSQLARDPGLLVVLKELPRLDPRQEQLGPNQPQSSRSSRAGSQADRKARESWTLASQDLLLAMNQRLYAAAMSGKRRPEVETLPIKLHRDANVVAEYKAEWPAALERRVPGADTGAMTVHYVRAEVKDFNPAILRDYERQSRGSKYHTILDGNAVWVESLRPIPDSGLTRSVDIVVTKGGGGGGYGEFAGAGGPGGGGTQAAFTLEVLSVEVPDVKAAANTAAAR